MGDAILENTWDGEDEIDLTKNYLSDADDSVDSGGPDDGSSGPTAVKKRKRLASLKEKKKRSKQGGISLDGSSSGAMTVDEMLLCMVLHRPPRDDSASHAAEKGQEFSPLDFVSPSPTEGSSSSKQCPFVRAVSDNIPNYKRLLGTGAASAGDANGCPIILVVCSSASRATEIIRSLSGRPLKCKVAKLFAKHFKISEQVNMLALESFPVAVGTPHRLSKLIEVGALSLRLTQLVLVDMQPDSKMFNIITLPAVKHDFYDLLYSYIFPERSHLKISLIN